MFVLVFYFIILFFYYCIRTNLLVDTSSRNQISCKKLLSQHLVAQWSHCLQLPDFIHVSPTPTCLLLSLGLVDTRSTIYLLETHKEKKAAFHREKVQTWNNTTIIRNKKQKQNVSLLDWVPVQTQLFSQSSYFMILKCLRVITSFESMLVCRQITVYSVPQISA